MKGDPELAEFIGTEKPILRVWLGPSRHLVAYNVVGAFNCSEDMSLKMID